MSMNTHLKGILAFISVFDLAFFYIVDILHDVHNGSVSTLSSMPCQTFAVSPVSSDLVDLCPNLWCNNSKETFFLGICFFDFDFSFIFIKNTCFLCALYSNVTIFCLLSLNKTVQNPLWKRQVCPEWINVIMGDNQSQKFGANITLYNVEVKGFTLSSHISIWNFPVFLAVMKFLSKTSI